MKKKYILSSILLALYVPAILALTLFVKLKEPFEASMLVNFGILFAIIIVYSLIFYALKFYKGFVITGVGIVLAGLYLLIGMPKDPVGFDDIAVILGWLIIQGFFLVLGIVVELVSRFIKKRKGQ